MINFALTLIVAASVAKAVEILKEKESAFEKKTSETNATGFTQSNCQLANAYHVKTLPSFRAVDEWPCSYAGTLPSNSDESNNLFFWIYPAIDADAPVTIWLNGGPGASSTLGNFLFNSPLKIAYKTGTTDQYDMYTTTDTWIKTTTMIYID